MDNFEEKLIISVKENDILYDKTKSGYKNTQIKANIWRKIANNLGTSDEACMKRWRGLRDRFVRESKKLLSPSGSAYSDVGTWEHYESLKFLKDHLMPRQTKGTHREMDTIFDASSLLEMPETQSDQDLFSPQSSSSQSRVSSTPKPRRKKIEDGADELTETFLSAVDAFKKACDTQSSPIEIFMKSMALKLEKLPVILQNNAILEITQYVVKLENVHNGLSNKLPELS